ncbi:uncharacterized protein LOC124450265 isoform X2 [Xenia sp. Carnegie-2017]|uniref:uncharacterized protein LOC124450265 isoform X2 n=1 Tax=Xenia sp. Carnegie-2017 TaxID=2897299 RepID=UPI001F0482A0|nr:uncharacterized protein LOC124450265 isoform X2 [Xenia sp. Carnegie-2017]
METSSKIEDEMLNMLQWTEDSHSLKDFVDVFSLPQVVKVIRGYDGGEHSATIGYGEVLTLHGIRESRIFHAEDISGNHYALKCNFSGEFHIVPNLKKNGCQSLNVFEINNFFPKSVLFLESLDANYGLQEDVDHTEIGEMYKILKVENGQNPEKVLIKVLNMETNRECTLTSSCTTSFLPLTDCKKHTCLELRSQTFEFPTGINFIVEDGRIPEIESALKPSRYLSLIEETDFITVIATTVSSDESFKFCFEIPKDLDIKFVIADGFDNGSKHYTDIVNTLNDRFDVLKFMNTCEPLLIRRQDQIHEFNYDAIKEYIIDKSILSPKLEDKEVLDEVNAPALPPRKQKAPFRRATKSFDLPPTTYTDYAKKPVLGRTKSAQSKSVAGVQIDSNLHQNISKEILERSININHEHVNNIKGKTNSKESVDIPLKPTRDPIDPKHTTKRNPPSDVSTVSHERSLVEEVVSKNIHHKPLVVPQSSPKSTQRFGSAISSKMAVTLPKTTPNDGVKPLRRYSQSEPKVLLHPSEVDNGDVAVDEKKSDTIASRREFFKNLENAVKNRHSSNPTHFAKKNLTNLAKGTKPSNIPPITPTVYPTPSPMVSKDDKNSAKEPELIHQNRSNIPPSTIVYPTLSPTVNKDGKNPAKEDEVVYQNPSNIPPSTIVYSTLSPRFNKDGKNPAKKDEVIYENLSNIPLSSIVYPTLSPIVNKDGRNQAKEDKAINESSSNIPPSTIVYQTSSPIVKNGYKNPDREAKVICKPPTNNHPSTAVYAFPSSVVDFQHNPDTDSSMEKVKQSSKNMEENTLISKTIAKGDVDDAPELPEKSLALKMRTSYHGNEASSESIYQVPSPLLTRKSNLPRSGHTSSSIIGPKALIKSDENPPIVPIVPLVTPNRPFANHPYKLICNVPLDLSGLSVVDVADILRNLNMGQYAHIFEEELIDGRLLTKLTDSDLESFNMTTIHRTKLMNFIKGWRPQLTTLVSSSNH